MITNKREIGNGAEDFVSNYMQSLGYKILTTNFGIPDIGEIDIIARYKETVYFVEVKARSNPLPYGGMRGCISSRKLGKVRRCADIYLQQSQNQDMYSRVLGAYVYITPEKNYEKIQLVDLTWNR